MNKVILFGNLTRDPELKSLPSGMQVANFGLATNRRVKRNEQWQDEAEFHNITVYGRQAETSAQYLKKGSQALIEGRIHTRSWDSPEKGKQYRTEIIAERVQFGSKGGGGGASGASRQQGSPAAVSGKSTKSDEGIQYPEEDINPDDIPF